MPGRRYEFRIAGSLSERARSAFRGMDVADVPAETVISGVVDDDGGVREVLALIQSLGLKGSRYAGLTARGRCTSRFCVPRTEMRTCQRPPTAHDPGATCR